MSSRSVFSGLSSLSNISGIFLDWVANLVEPSESYGSEQSIRARRSCSVASSIGSVGDPTFLGDLDDTALEIFHPCASRLPRTSRLFVCAVCNKSIGAHSNVYFAHDLTFCTTACRIEFARAKNR